MNFIIIIISSLLFNKRNYLEIWCNDVKQNLMDQALAVYAEDISLSVVWLLLDF